MDHDFCKKTVFRKPIAHGLLILAIGSGLGMMFPPIRTLAFLAIKEWKFVEPCFIVETIRVKARVLEIEERSRGRRGVMTWGRQIVNQHHKPVEEGTIMTLVEGRRMRNQESGVGNQESEKPQ